jgi:dipeptidyl aminopeptidase/acylaminoacyl peptidase
MSEKFTYGDDPFHYALLHRATGPANATVIFIHGGFWRWSPDYFGSGDAATAALVAAGYNVWQIEYRPVGKGGGWPTTLEDVAAAIDLLATVPDIATGRIITVGHSAGGHLAVWALSHTGPVTLSGAVSLAGVVDLLLAESDRIGRKAAANFIGGSAKKYPERYDNASPAVHPVVGIPVRIVHGDEDFVVPMNQSESYVAVAAAVGQDVALTVVRGDHGVVVDPTTSAWPAVMAAVAELTGS